MTAASRTSPEAGQNGGQKEKVVPPSAREWRTPPLWGCRDSAPYLHDGRARTLEAAIVEHDGEAAESSNRFAQLSSGEKMLLNSYLMTLGAPQHSATASTR